MAMVLEMRSVEDRLDPETADARAALRGDRAAARRLCVALGPVILATLRAVLGARHPEIEDLGQESMLAVLNGLSSFEWQSSLRHYARRIATKRALTAIRDRRNDRDKVERAGAEWDVRAPAAEDPAEHAMLKRRRAVLAVVLRRLPSPQAEVLILHVVLGHSVDDTAAILQVPPNTIRGRLVTAKQKLRDEIHRDPTLEELREFDHD
jgi:RNA polymerase sigma-70 factor (ECF subfamily)